MTLIILLGIIAGAFLLWKFRVPLLARLLGQPEARIRRQLRKRQ